jgi:hypothetical protein
VRLPTAAAIRSQRAFTSSPATFWIVFSALSNIVCSAAVHSRGAAFAAFTGAAASEKDDDDAAAAPVAADEVDDDVDVDVDDEGVSVVATASVSVASASGASPLASLAAFSSAALRAAFAACLFNECRSKQDANRKVI